MNLNIRTFQDKFPKNILKCSAFQSTELISISCEWLERSNFPMIFQQRSMHTPYTYLLHYLFRALMYFTKINRTLLPRNVQPPKYAAIFRQTK